MTQSTRIAYKKDAFGNPIFARVAWLEGTSEPKPIVLVYHGGGLIVGSSEIVPKPQIEYLANLGFIVVIPNYRLAPQVTAKESFADCEESYDWATSALPDLMRAEHSLELDTSKVVAMGHSSGGTLGLHLASCKPLKAVTAFYPSLLYSDPSTSAHQPTSAPPFGAFPDFAPTDDDWAAIKPANQQVSEAPMAVPGSVPAPRNKWQMHVLKHGQWIVNVLPDGDLAAVDPLTRVNANWPAVCIVQGETDNVPGSSLLLAQRAEKMMKEVGVQEVRLDVVPGEAHMFDLPPTVGTSDLGIKWQAVVKGLDWLRYHA